MWSFEKLSGESFSNGDERIPLVKKTKKENVYRKKELKVEEVLRSGTSIL